jgi:hypothetical protein
MLWVVGIIWLGGMTWLLCRHTDFLGSIRAGYKTTYTWKQTRAITGAEAALAISVFAFSLALLAWKICFSN